MNTLLLLRGGWTKLRKSKLHFFLLQCVLALVWWSYLRGRSFTDDERNLISDYDEGWIVEKKKEMIEWKCNKHLASYTFLSEILKMECMERSCEGISES